jgi:non-specific serine/threonine protein kinase
LIAISAGEAWQIAEIRAAYLRAMEQLTPQQRVVAGLILEGKTNQEIAERLVLSRGTVNSHVSHIGSLGFPGVGPISRMPGPPAGRAVDSPRGRA